MDLYKNVEVKFIPGRQAVMTIYNKEGEQLEKITLSDYNDKEKLHELFIEKGFEKYSDEELAEIRKEKEEAEAELEAERQKRLRGNINQLAKPLTGQKMSKTMLRAMKANPKLSRAHQIAQVKDDIEKMKRARKDFMMVGMPDDRPKSRS